MQYPLDEFVSKLINERGFQVPVTACIVTVGGQVTVAKYGDSDEAGTTGRGFTTEIPGHSAVKYPVSIMIVDATGTFTTVSMMDDGVV